MIQQQINLYHPIFRKQEKKFSAKAMLQSGAVVIAGITLMYVYSWWQVNSLKTQEARIEREQQIAMKQIEEMTKRISGQAADPLLKQEVARLESLLETTQRMRDLLQQGRAGNTQGYSNHLIAFARQHTAGVWLTGVSIVGGGDEIKVEGRTTEPELVPQYLQKLSAEKSLSGTQLNTFVISRPEAKKGPAPHYVEFLATTATKDDLKKP